ncbi:hypothetical protein [Burkholderia ubonensis]|nr:hypothetical protein [Burkholderia ubonensis]
MKHEVKFNVGKEVVKMIDALERCPAVRRIVWMLAVAGATWIVIHAIRWW